MFAETSRRLEHDGHVVFFVSIVPRRRCVQLSQERRAFMKRITALALCFGLALPGCVTTGPRRTDTGRMLTAMTQERGVLTDYARQMPIGTRVRAVTADNRRVRGTLVKRTDTAIVIQPRARVAEPLVEIPFDQLVTLEQEVPSSGTGKAVAAGLAAGAGAALGVILILIAIAGD